jgi:uncharacterized protein YbjT (DUF2867 family)
MNQSKAGVRMSEEDIGVIVAGATGFIGAQLGRSLGKQFQLIGLSRSHRSLPHGYRECRSVDLFSRADSIRALSGAKIGVYLVHSMIPSARLVQATFQDLDLLCADNFGRAAAANGLTHIVYVGGLMPHDEDLSDHLRSRLEVEHALSAHGVPTITLRAGMVVGGAGSSFQILARLVKRLPMMLCPQWTLTQMQPVALSDVIAVIASLLKEAPSTSKVYDLGAPEVISYRELMSRLAEIMNVRRRLIPVPFLSPSLSRLWVSLTTGAPAALARPLIKSLRHTMVARASQEFRHPAEPLTSVDTMLQQAWVESCSTPEHEPRAFQTPPTRRGGDRVVSVQRMNLPSGRSAEWATEEYIRWLPRSFWGILPISVRTKNDQIGFYLWGLSTPLLLLARYHDASDVDRQVLSVKGGHLANPGTSGRLEFRQVCDERTLLVGLVDFEPALPWWLYRVTQALAHRVVMTRFRRHLASL